MEDVPDFVAMDTDPDDPDPLIDASDIKQEKSDDVTETPDNVVQVKAEPLDVDDIEEEESKENREKPKETGGLRLNPSLARDPGSGSSGGDPNQKKIIILNPSGYKEMSNDFIVHKRMEEFKMLVDYKCQLCSYLGESTEDTLLHMQTIHGICVEKRYVCSECTFRSDYRMPYLLHYERDHMNTKDFLCEFCDFSTTDYTIRSRHLEIEHNQCVHCDYVGESRIMVAEHVANEHVRKVYKCDHCNYQSVTQNGIDLHVTSQHVEKSQARTRTCRMCAFRTNNTMTLYEHMFSDHNLIEVKCNECEFVGGSAWELNEHSESHELKGYQCDQCDYNTNRIMFLNRHKKARHSEKSFHCPYCTFKSAQRWCVKQHIVQVHEKSRLYPCEYCDYKASSRGNLNVHIRGVHERDKRYECTQCDFKTCHKSGLLKHLRSHRGKELICELCDFKTSSKGTMFVHKKDAHGAPCPQCDYVATSHGALESHLRMKHDERHEDEDENAPIIKRQKVKKAKTRPLSSRKYIPVVERVCLFCTFVAEDAEDLEDHNHQSHTEEWQKIEIQVCQYCKPATHFSTKAERADHLKDNHADHLVCSLCPGLRFEEGEDELDEHWRQMHAKVRHAPCGVCGEKFKMASLLRAHLRTKHPRIEYACRQEHESLAIVTFASQSAYQQHVLAVHKPLSCFPCHVCGKSFTRELALRRHLQHAHIHPTSHMPGLACSQCSHVARTARGLKSHLEARHDMEGGEIFQCDLCRYNALSKVTLARHQKAAHPQCDLCEAHFGSEEELEDHTLFLHPDTLMCSLCQVRQASQAQLKEHMSLHYNESRFACQKCELEFDSFSDLNTHILQDHLLPAVGREQTDMGVFPCFECAFQASDIRELTRHVQVTHFQEEGRTFPCSECDYVAKSAFTLREHNKRCGKGKRKYRCQICGFEANHFNGLISHSQEAHRRDASKRMKCAECSFSTERAYNLKVHMKRHKRERAKREGNTSDLKASNKENEEETIQDH
ncbi:hypothetical protein TCAL_07799 [Tigriopus californicus]|uniref:C2H2-type domain-containing protein n=1 Tax=Tigriopus californicus TaxID=6832 RepID=A0A553PTV9_TIGCA|nr:hypothetical protein TCAL_07799 [Tigriopus californicus]